MANDCLRFAMHFFHPIQQSAAHTYHSASPLSPESSIFRSVSLPEKTRIAKFYGRPDNWGSVLRTITGVPGDFACVTTIGRGTTTRITAARNDGTVGIYDSVAGVLRLSLNPPYPIQTMAGSLDGSILFCTHRNSPSVTVWDIQTGGLVHTFTSSMEARDTAVSLNGRYLACGLPDGTVNVWEVANRTGGLAFGSDSPITCLCWLAPEERLMVANGVSVHIRDVTTGTILVHSFNVNGPVCGATYSQKFNQLAVVTSWGADNSITIIDAQTGTPSAPSKFEQRLSCFTFSKTTRELVCSMKTRGRELMLVNPAGWHWTRFDFPAMIKSVSTLSNGTVVANVAGSGIQLLSLDRGHASSEQLLPPALTVHSLDKGRIIAIVPTSREHVILLETTTMSQVLTIPGRNDTDHTVVLCASLENGIAVRRSAREGKEYLQLWEFDSPYPRWTVQINELSSAGCVSPACARLVTFHDRRTRSSVCVWDVHNGRLLAKLDAPWSPCPLDITFDSETLFYAHYDTYRTPYVITALPWLDTHTYSIRCIEKASLDERGWKNQYYVDDSHEWVFSGLQRICWIPPG